MENLKHTLGEWVANPHGANKHQVWCNGTKIAACDNSVQSEIYRQKSEDEMAANAKLIAAAPDLLKACISALKDVQEINKMLIANGYHGYVLMETELDEVIKKATT